VVRSSVVGMVDPWRAEVAICVKLR
jgi:hypothetical protein